MSSGRIGDRRHKPTNWEAPTSLCIRRLLQITPKSSLIRKPSYMYSRQCMLNTSTLLVTSSSNATKHRYPSSSHQHHYKYHGDKQPLSTLFLLIRFHLVSSLQLSDQLKQQHLKDFDSEEEQDDANQLMQSD